MHWKTVGAGLAGLSYLGWPSGVDDYDCFNFNVSII